MKTERPQPAAADPSPAAPAPEIAHVFELLLAVCREIAADRRVDLVDSERRIRLYAAIHRADAL